MWHKVSFTYISIAYSIFYFLMHSCIVQLLMMHLRIKINIVGAGRVVGWVDGGDRIQCTGIISSSGLRALPVPPTPAPSPWWLSSPWTSSGLCPGAAERSRVGAVAPLVAHSYKPTRLYLYCSIHLFQAFERVRRLTIFHFKKFVLDVDHLVINLVPIWSLCS